MRTRLHIEEDPGRTFVCRASASTHLAVQAVIAVVGFFLASAFVYIGWQTGDVRCERAVEGTPDCLIRQAGPFGAFPRVANARGVTAARLERRASEDDGKDLTAILLDTPTGPVELTRFASNTSVARKSEELDAMRAYLADKSATRVTIDLGETNMALPFGVSFQVLMVLFVLLIGFVRIRRRASPQHLSLDLETGRGVVRSGVGARRGEESFALSQVDDVRTMHGMAAVDMSFPKLAAYTRAVTSGAPRAGASRSDLEGNYAVVALALHDGRTVPFPVHGPRAVPDAEMLAQRVRDALAHARR